MATTTDYINQLKADKTNLVNNLIQKGASATQDETFTSLVPKVLDIETGITPTGTINITENGTYDVTDKASANVNVEGLNGTTIEITKNGTYTPEQPYNAFTEVKANIEPDVSDYFADTLQNSYAYQVIKKIPAFNVGNATGNNLFSNLPFLTEIPFINTSTCITSQYMFSNDIALLNIPALDFSNVTNSWCTFNKCSSLITIAQLDMQKVRDIRDMCFGCKNLENLGGFLNLGQAYETTKSSNYLYYKLDLSSSSKLTHDSLMNVINNLYDIASKGVKTQQLVLGSTNISKLSAEQLAIGTSKGWSIS